MDWTDITLIISVNDLPEGSQLPVYADFAEDIEGYLDMDGEYKYEQYLVEIKPYNSDVSEDDKDLWDRTDNNYNWNDSKLSFVPQEAAYYVLKLVVTESRMPGKQVPKYQSVEARNRIDQPSEPFRWVQDNLVSVILFSISAVLLIAIIVLFVVKPSDKTVEEVDLETLKGKKEKKDQE